QKTTSQRSKEDAHDYRYMPDPDIPPLELTDEFIQKAKSEMPKRMPDDWRTWLKDLGLNDQQIDILIEAEVDNDDVTYLMFIEEASNEDKQAAQHEANWIINIEIPLSRELGIKLVPQRAKWALLYSPIYKLVKSNLISSTNAKALIKEVLQISKLPEDMEDYAKTKGYIQVSDEGAIAKIVEGVLEGNPSAVEDIKNGEMKAIGFLVGQVMKASKGQANPGLAQKLIKQQIENL
ncbi:MAG: hypothetical protein AAB914_01575, partial [Patescibacteria group bacterium]